MCLIVDDVLKKKKQKKKNYCLEDQVKLLPYNQILLGVINTHVSYNFLIYTLSLDFSSTLHASAFVPVNLFS